MASFTVLGLLLIVSVYIRLNKAVHITSSTALNIKKAIQEFEDDKNHCVSIRREWPSTNGEIEEYLSPSILIWDILKSYGSIIIDTYCPFCNLQENTRSYIRRTNLWTDGTGKTAYCPRVVYNTSSSFLLVSAVYTCLVNHQIPSHHPQLLSSLPSNVYIPFYLTNRAGFTVELLTQISSLVDHGLSFLAIENIVCDQYEQAYHRLKLRYHEDLKRNNAEELSFPEFQQSSFPFPHNTIIRDVFSAYSALFDKTFTTDMESRVAEWIFCDHTFKSAANIGFVRKSDKKWVKLFKSVFVVVGEGGDILHWKFTRGESIEEVRGILINLRERMENKDKMVKGIVIDNCCKWSGLLGNIFPGAVIKLDLFHAVQRFLKAIPISSRISSGIAKEYGLIFRQRMDLKEKRTLPTASTAEILRNLEEFECKWGSKLWNGQLIINENAKKAIQNLKLHIQKGCLSEIPVPCTTSKNERLHREMNSILSTNRIGLELAYLRCARLFFRLNNENKSVKAQQLCCPPSCQDNLTLSSFGVDTDVNIWDGSSAIYSLKNLSNENIFIIKDIIRTSIDTTNANHSSTFSLDHMYYSTDNGRQNTAKELALDALQYYQIYTGLSKIGGTRFLSQSRIPYSIGIQHHAAERLEAINKHSLDILPDQFLEAQSILLEHVQGFGLEIIPIDGDGNCFFTTVAFQLQQLMSATSFPNVVQQHLSTLQITSNMTTQALARHLRCLAVREWQGANAADYTCYLPSYVDYNLEISNFKSDGYFQGPLGDLMPLTLSNVLQLPLVIITSATHTPIFSVCPLRVLDGTIPLILAYNSFGAGHYDAAVEKSNSLTCGAESTHSVKEEKKMCTVQAENKEVVRSCRCGSLKGKSNKLKRSYRNDNRCKCILKHRKCSRSCKCKGKCGGRKCKDIVFTTKNKYCTPPKEKHVLQKSRKALNLDATFFSATLNFFESCLLCAIIHYANRSDKNFKEEYIHSMFNTVIDTLLSIGIILPLENKTLQIISKEFRKMKKDFDKK